MTRRLTIEFDGTDDDYHHLANAVWGVAAAALKHDRFRVRIDDRADVGELNDWWYPNDPWGEDDRITT